MEPDTEMAPLSKAVDREKTAPFLIRAFVKIGGFHRTALFEDRTTIPLTDEHQIFTWKDATLKELLTTLREVAPATTEFRHPLARYAFKTLYADSTQRGAFTTKDLGTVYSRDILGEPGALVINSSEEGLPLDPTPEEEEKVRQEKTLDDLRFVPGDYLLVNIVMPKALPQNNLVKNALNGAGSGGPGKWGPGGRERDSGWNAPVAPLPVGGLGRGGGHWRARPGIAPPAGGRGIGDRDRDRERERERDRDRDRERGRGRDEGRSFPGFPGRRSSPPPRGGGRIRGGRDRDRYREPDRDRGYRNRRSVSRSRSKSRSRSRSRTPPRRSHSPPRRRR